MYHVLKAIKDSSAETKKQLANELYLSASELDDLLYDLIKERTHYVKNQVPLVNTKLKYSTVNVELKLTGFGADMNFYRGKAFLARNLHKVLLAYRATRGIPIARLVSIALYHELK